MARAVVDIGTLIESIPGVYGGRPRLARSGLPIIQFVAEHQFGGLDEVRAAHPYVDEESLYAGLAYYLANKDALDAELEERDREGVAAYQAWRREQGHATDTPHNH